MSAEHYENPEDASALREELANREQEREEELAENLSTKERLQRRLDEQTVDAEILDEPVEFRKPGAGMQKRAIRISAQYEGVDEDEIPPEDTLEIVDFMTESLAELSVDDELDEEFWDQFGFDDLEGTFEQVLLSFGDVEEDLLPDEDRDEIEEFRDE